MKYPYPKSIVKILHNKIVFYVVLFLAITNIIGYTILGNFTGVILFLLVGCLTYLFDKNKTLVLLVPLLVTSLFMMGKTVKEGLTNSGSEEKKKHDKTKDSHEKKPETTNGTGGSNSHIIHPLDNNTNNTSTTAESVSKTEEAEPEANEAQVDGFKKRSRIDYASTIEDAYGNLSQILGSDGIKGLTDDTQKLMKQQLQLAEAMKSMTPIVEQAQNMLQGLDIKNIGGLAELAKQFTGKTQDKMLIQQV